MEEPIRLSARLWPALVKVLVLPLLLLVPTAHTEVFTAGDLAPRGVPDGDLNVGDLVVLQKFVSGTDVPVGNESLIADVAPLDNPDGELNAADILVLTRAILGDVFLSPVVLPPVITDFTPKSATTGTLVTVTGNALTGAGLQVILNRQGGGTISAPVASHSSDTLTFTIPTGATDGPITIMADALSDTSADQLQIIASSSFTLAAAPGIADLIEGQSTSYAVTLSSTNGFTQLADLAVTGLPAGVTASFDPAQITAGQRSLLTVNAPAGQTPGLATLSISASATVDGISLNEVAGVTLDVQAVTTSFLGRTVINDTLQTVLGGVTVTLLGVDGDGNPTGCTAQTVSDEAGNFAFTNLPAACTGEQLIRYDGLTVTNQTGQYAGVDLLYNIVNGQVTTSPVLIHLPRIDNMETVCVEENAATDQFFTFDTIPNLEMTVYAGTTFTPPATMPVNSCPAGTFPIIAIDIPVDRLPDQMPADPNVIDPFIVAFQPANAVASQPVAVTFPNLLNTLPGTNMNLSTLDPTKGAMVVYGTGTVSADGSKIIPDFDPANPGKRFGLVHFDWHGPNNPRRPPAVPPLINPAPPGCVNNPQAGKPVDLASGVEVISEIDIALNGPRGSISIQRTYRTLSNEGGPFGIGGNHNYGYRLDTNTPTGAVIINLIMPDGNRFPFAFDGVGSYTNQSVPVLRGAVMTVGTGDEVNLRFKDGTVFHFVPSTVALGSLLQTITDVNSNVITLVRNPTVPAQITEIIDPVSRKLLLTYDATNRITSIVDPIGRTVRYTYNALGSLETVRDPEGGITRYNYAAANRLTQVTDERGVIMAQNTYDANGRVIQQIQADGGVLGFAYTLMNPLVPESPVQETVLTDPLGNKTTYRFNPQGVLLDVTDPLGQTRVYELELGSNLLLSITGTALCEVCSKSGAGDVSFTYDANGNLLTRTDALNNTTTLTYEPVFNKVASVMDPLGHLTTYTYDATGNLLNLTDENNQTTTLTYNGFGQVVTMTDPLSHTTTFTYDSSSNLETVTDPLGNTTTYRYDAISRPIKITDALGQSALTVYDRLGQVVSSTDARGNTTLTQYDPAGNRAAVTDARGNTISFAYNAINRLETRSDSIGNADTRTYDLNGNLTQFVDRRGQISTFTYDTVNRVTVESYQDGSLVTRSYDAQGRLVQVDDSASGSFTFTHDAAGRLTRFVGPYGTVDYTRDELGRVEQRQVVGQSAVDYAFDPAGNLLSAVMPQASVSYGYDARNLVDSETRLNGVTTNYGYDIAGRLLSITHANGAQVLEAQSYAYDAIGNRIQKASTNAQALITQASINAYAADSNQLQQRGATSYTHDLNGNRLTETGPGGTTTYSWDSRNRLASIETATDVTLFQYDFAGNLIARESGIPGSPDPVINYSQQYVLDELTNVVYQSDTDGTQESILSGRSIDRHLAVIQSAGQVEYGLTDAINSTALTVDSARNTVGQFQYEPFGETTAMGSAYPFVFTGRVPVTGGLYHYRARYYDPLAGRFVSEDPIGLAGGNNLYSYVLGNPINLVDPLGLSATGCGKNYAIAVFKCGVIPGSVGAACLLGCLGVSGPALPYCITGCSALLTAGAAWCIVSKLPQLMGCLAN